MTDGTFVVNTEIDQPHGDHEITAMAAIDGMLVTADDHGEFRLWVPQESSTICIRSRPPPPHCPPQRIWNCRSLAQFRPTAITATAFSSDASLLAIAYGPLLTLWDPSSNALRSVLAYPLTPLRDILFLGTRCIVRSDCGIYVWNVLTLEIDWFYALPGVTSLCVVRGNQLWASLTTITRSGPSKKRQRTKDLRRTMSHLICFDMDRSKDCVSPQTTTPVNIVHVPHMDIQAVHFSRKNDMILVMDQYSRLHAVMHNNKDDDDDNHDNDDVKKSQVLRSMIETTNASMTETTKEEVPASKWAQMYGQCCLQMNKDKTKARKPTTSSEVYLDHHPSSSSTTTTGTVSGTSLSASTSLDLFEAPAHVLPPLRSLYRSFMDSMLTKSKKKDHPHSRVMLEEVCDPITS